MEASRAKRPTYDPSGSRPLWFSVLLISVLACLFAVPATAPAVDYTVNSIGDQVDEAPGSDGCKTSLATCTLRAAIEESNTSTGVNDTIEFSASFDGEVGDTIDVATPLPTITDRVRIEGFPSPLQCQTDYFSLPGPCVGVRGPAGGTAFTIAAERVVLIGLAISGAQTAIEAVGAPGLEAWNDWFGIKLDGSGDPVDTGIFLDQGSNGAIIGGSSSVARNIFAHNASAGIDIDGANFAYVRGNGFGVLPDGNTLAANGKNIEITDATAGDDRVAEGTWIGGTLSDEQLANPICDGACNLIAGALESGIDLVGDDPSEGPVSGSTRISGNHIGLNAFGTTGIPNEPNGVLVGAADNVIIGGPRPGDRNMINGGIDGVLAEPGAGNLTVEGNWIGLDPSGAKSLSPPAHSGISTESGHQVEVTGNRISIAAGTAIQLDAQGAVAQSNVIGKGVGGEDLPGGSIGIHLLGSSCVGCNLTHGNTVANAAGYGVLVETNRNRVYGNRIEGSGAAGIRIEGPPPGGFATQNIIGGDVAAEENTISRSAGAAVEIAEVVEFGATRANQVARNRGSFNGGPFIDLVSGGNDDISSPTFLTTTRSGASGEGAVPGAVIRVFRKASSSPGEVEGFLAEALADESGGWAVTYPGPIPGGTTVAASQTSTDEGTSELAFSTTEEADSDGDEGGAGAGGILEQGPTGSIGAPPPILPSPIALVRGKVLINGGSVLIRVACKRGVCSSVLKIFARPVGYGSKVRDGKHSARRGTRLILIGKRRFRVAAGVTRALRVRLDRRGRALVRSAGRRGLKVRLSGMGVRNRVVRVRQSGGRTRRRG